QVGVGDLGALAGARYDLAFAAFTFDNIPTDAEKLASFAALRAVLAPGGHIIVIVSSPEIYVHEWASFSTKDFPEDGRAAEGDRVQIIMLDVPDRRPVEDVVCGDAHYRQLFTSAHLQVRDMLRPLATGQERMRWISETTVAPWAVYVLGAV